MPEVVDMANSRIGLPDPLNWWWGTGERMRRWTLESGQSPPPSIEVVHRGPWPGPTGWPEVRLWDDVSGGWMPLPAPPRRTAQPEVVVRVTAATATFRGLVRTSSDVALAGPAWLSTVDIEAHGLRQEIHSRRTSGRVDRLPGGAWLSQPGEPDWGHWLLDLLPRAATLDEVVPPDIPFVISSDAPPYVESLLAVAGLGHRRVSRVAPGGGVVGFDELWVATSGRQRDAFAPSWAGLYRGMVERARSSAGLPRSGERLLLSRGATRSYAAKRKLTTRDAVEEAAIRHGCRRWVPETLPVPEQVVAVSSASRMVGEGGSGMISCLFGHAGADEVLLRSCVNRQTIHPLVAGVTGMRLWVIEGHPVRVASEWEPHGPSDWDGSWTLDPKVVDRAMEAMT